MRSKFLIFVAIICFACSCASIRITSSWKAPASTPVKYEKILVITLAQPDNELKEKMEQHLLGDLKSHGIEGISAYRQYGPKGFDQMSEEGSINQINNTGADAILTIVLFDKSKEREYVPGHALYTPYAIYYDRFWGYYNTMYDRVYNPGYYVTNTEYFWESNLYDASTKQLVYSVQTKSFNPEDAESLAHQYGQLILNNMIKQEVISE